MTNWSNKTSLSKSAFDFALGVNEADWPDFQANPYSYEPTTFRLTSLVTTRDSDSKVLQDITYVYDPVGNIVKLTDGSHDCVFTNNQQVNAACGYTYDAMYRLTAAAGREHVALAQNADTDATTFLRSAWAHLNNSQQLVNYTENYVYDTAGNLTQMQHAGASTYTRYIDIDTASNRGLQRPDQNSPDFTNSFDANGNQVLMGHVNSLAWDYQDRLQKVVLVPREDDQDDAEWYVYDGAGQRVRKVRETVGYGGTTLTREEKIYLGDAEIKRVYLTTYDEYDVPTTTKVLDRTSVHVMDDKSRVALAHYWSVDTNLLELDNTNQLNTHRIRYQYGNHLGSASLELDAAGSVISYEEYLPYGGTSFVAGTSQTEVRLKEYRYSAKERDNSTGFYYYGARYYAPWLGRWMSTDPLGLKAGINDYAFVHGNPITRIDVDGREDEQVGTSDGDYSQDILGQCSAAQACIAPENESAATEPLDVESQISKLGEYGIKVTGIDSSQNGWTTENVEKALGLILKMKHEDLAQLKGLTINFAERNANNPDYGGLYQHETRTIDLYSHKIIGDNSNFGDESALDIFHEMGHALFMTGLTNKAKLSERETNFYNSAKNDQDFETPNTVYGAGFADILRSHIDSIDSRPKDLTPLETVSLDPAVKLAVREVVAENFAISMVKSLGLDHKK